MSRQSIGLDAYVVDRQLLQFSCKLYATFFNVLLHWMKQSALGKLT
jgi:hypothetical protein